MASDLDVFRGEFVPNIETHARLSFASWQKSAPADFARWVAYRDALLAGDIPAPPSMTTRYGKALVAAGKLITQEAPPPPPPPPPPATGTVYDSLAELDNSGTSDVTSSLQAWLNSIPNGTSSNPSIARLRPGIYRIHSMLTVSGRSHLILESGARVLGGDAELKWTTPVTLSGTSYVGNDSLRLIRFVDCSNCAIRYLTLRGASPMPVSGDGFKPWEANVQHMHSLTVSRCTEFAVQFVKIIGSGGGDGVNYGNENTGTRSTGVIEDCDIRDCHRCTIALVGSGGVTIRRNVLARGGFWMIDLEPNNLASSNYNTVIEGNRWESQGGLVSRCAIGAFAGSKDGQGECEDVVIRGNVFVGRAAEIRFNTNINGGFPYPRRIKRVRIEGNACDTNSPQVELRQIDTLDVSGNDFQVSAGTEVGLWDCTDFRISGSTYTTQ